MPTGPAGAGAATTSVGERLISMLFLAGIAHAIVILGLSFGADGSSDAAPGMEVLLVTDDLPEAHNNDSAAYLAQRAQLGSGNTDTLPTGSPAAHAAPAPEGGAGENKAGKSSAATAGTGGDRVLVAQAPTPRIRWFGTPPRAESPASPDHPTESESLPSQGRGDAPELVLRGDPKTGLWLSPDTKNSPLAPYLDAWRRKVERVGTLNFPAVARRADLSGSPIIEVALSADGRLIEATIQHGSGHAEIDQAALLILKVASPFEPFPPALAHEYGALRFAYQWEFLGGQLGTGVVTAGTNGAAGP